MPERRRTVPHWHWLYLAKTFLSKFIKILRSFAKKQRIRENCIIIIGLKLVLFFECISNSDDKRFC